MQLLAAAWSSPPSGGPHSTLSRIEAKLDLLLKEEWVDKTRNTGDIGPSLEVQHFCFNPEAPSFVPTAPTQTQPSEAPPEESEKAPQESEKLRAGDETDALKIEVKNGLENYCPSLRDTLQEERLKGKFEADGKDRFEKELPDALSWLDENQAADWTKVFTEAEVEKKVSFESEVGEKNVSFEVESESGTKVFTEAEVGELLRRNVRMIKQAAEEPLLRTIDWLNEKIGELTAKLDEDALVQQVADLERQLRAGRSLYETVMTQMRKLQAELTEREERASSSSGEAEEDNDEQPFCPICGEERASSSNGEAEEDSDGEAKGDSETGGTDDAYWCCGDCGVWAHLRCIETEPATYTKRGKRFRSRWLLSGPGFWCPDCEDPADDRCKKGTKRAMT